MGKFTPGPWRWWPCHDGSFKPSGDYVQIASGKTQVAKVQILSTTEEDLVLMIEAPTLLQMVKQLMAVIDDGISDPVDIDIYQQAKSLVEKLEGGVA